MSTGATAAESGLDEDRVAITVGGLDDHVGLDQVAFGRDASADVAHRRTQPERVGPDQDPWVGAARGVVLVPNPFYRVAKAPQFQTAENFSFTDPADRAKLTPPMGSLVAPGAAERGAAAFVAFLDAQAPVDKAKKIGTLGYCMGGPLVVRTAAAVPGRIGGGASFHGGGLVPSGPTARTCWRRRSGARCISVWRRTTTSVSPMRRTS